MNRFGWLAVIALAALATVEGCNCSEDETLLGPGTGSGANGTGLTGTGGTGNGFITGGNGGMGNSGTGGCGASCVENSVGVGTENPFHPDDGNSTGVGLDPDGALVLDQSLSGVPDIIWIANTSAGTVTKVDTNTYERLGRYRIAPTGGDPSRTSVNSLGDVFVGDRTGRRLIKISAAEDECPDTNGDSQITTSTGFDDVLAWGQDDCKIWDVDVPAMAGALVRGVAAQDLVVADPIPDDPNHTRIERYVWTGATNSNAPDARVFKYDADTGDLLIATAAPSPVYGLALDGNGNLWMCDYFSGRFGRVDTTKCTDQASCDAAEICTTTCDQAGNCTCTSCSTACEDAAKEEISIYNHSTGTVYGITVDYMQRVWIGGNGMKRYDPQAPVEPRLSTVAGTGFIHGVAADAEGWVWGADGGNSVYRVNGDTLEMLRIQNVPSKGMAVDGEGKIWTINYTSGASVIVPGPTINDYTPLVPAGNVAELGAPMCPGQCYTYSDMTGQQLALATNEPGYYREIFDGCAGSDTEWLALNWEVETPPGTFVAFYARTAESVDLLDAATWASMATDPPDNPPVNVSARFSQLGITPARYLELEVRLQGAITLDGFLTPRVLSFGVSHSCSDIPQ